MAEVFGAVASGAGLISLSLQLIDSAQKLKKLYNVSKDAPTTVAELCFELETMSLSLRQLRFHRNASITGDELLSRCLTTCDRMVTKIEAAVKKIEILIQKRRSSGRLYMAFKEPEIRALLEELERAKSSMSFAYMSYCHSWSLDESARNVALLQAQKNALSSQIMQLHSLEHAVHAGNSRILARLAVSAADNTSQDISMSSSQALQATKNKNQERRPLRKLRVSLPRYFTSRVWEFGLQESEAGWSMHLHIINERTADSFVFDVVRSGRVPAVRALLESGSLSMHDHAAALDYEPCESLLDIATRLGHKELCEFFLEQSPYLRDDTMMLSAMHRFVSCSRGRDSTFEISRKLADDMYSLFLDRHGLVLPITDMEHHNPTFTENVESNMLLTEYSLQKIQAGQFASIHDRAFDFKFEVAMKSIGWPAEALMNFMQPCDDSQLATAQDTQARTALHWAAKHFGYWAGVWWSRDICPDDAKAKSYAKLAKELLKMGSNAHAVNAMHETPFMTIMHQFMTFVDWPCCATAVRRWGEIVVEAGLDLNEYVHVENPLLQHLAEKRRAWNGETHYSLHPAEIRLTVFDESILAVQIKFCRPLSIWEQWVPPGAWDRDSRLPTTSFYMPPEVGDDEIYWRESKITKIYSSLYLILGTSQADIPFYSLTDFHEDWKALFIGTQDDHGMVATTISRGRARKRAGSSAITDRASSLPPEVTQQVYNKLPTHQEYGLKLYLDSDHWLPRVYRCPFELKWKAWGGSRSRKFSFAIELRRMLIDLDSRDTEKRLDALDDWEVQLLREQGHLDVVKRFAQRFCPELNRVVNKELERARLVEELA